MFPTLVWKVELSAQLRATIDTNVSAALARMRRDLPSIAPGKGWQSIQTLHRLEDFKDLVACIHRTVAGILQFLRIGYDEFEITACWATVLTPGAEHKAHYHPNNFLSGVYYLRTHPGADTVNFHDPRSQTGVLRPPVAELTAENTDQIVVRVKDKHDTNHLVHLWQAALTAEVPGARADVQQLETSPVGSINLR